MAVEDARQKALNKLYKALVDPTISSHQLELIEKKIKVLEK